MSMDAINTIIEKVLTLLEGIKTDLITTVLAVAFMMLIVLGMKAILEILAVKTPEEEEAPQEEK